MVRKRVQKIVSGCKIMICEVLVIETKHVILEYII